MTNDFFSAYQPSPTRLFITESLPAASGCADPFLQPACSFPRSFTFELYSFQSEYPHKTAFPHLLQAHTPTLAGHFQERHSFRLEFFLRIRNTLRV